MSLDQQQLHHLYQQDTTFMVNPPSFETWMSARREREDATKPPPMNWSEALGKERAEFERWYTINAFDLERNPVGSRDCSLQWEAWKAALAHARPQTLP